MRTQWIGANEHTIQFADQAAPTVVNLKDGPRWTVRESKIDEADPPKVINIVVAGLFGVRNQFEVSEREKVMAVKVKIAQARQVPTSAQRLMFQCVPAARLPSCLHVWPSLSALRRHQRLEDHMSLADYGVADGDILNLIIKQHDPALHVAAPEPEPQPEPQPHEGVPPARGAPILFKGDVWTVGGQPKGQPLGLLFDEDGTGHIVVTGVSSGPSAARDQLGDGLSVVGMRLMEVDGRQCGEIVTEQPRTAAMSGVVSFRDVMRWIGASWKSDHQVTLLFEGLSLA